MKRTLSWVSNLVNHISGYDQVVAKKALVAHKDSILQQSISLLKASKLNYTNHFEDRLKTQKEIHSLLQRQSSWSSSDLIHFTNLYKKDLDLDQSLTKLKLELDQASESFDSAHADYLNELRERYATECLVSDKVKSLSTIFTIGLLSFHISLFLIVQMYIEPKKKEELIRHLRDAVQSAKGTLKETSTGTEEIIIIHETFLEFVLRILQDYTQKMIEYYVLLKARIRNMIPVIN